MPGKQRRWVHLSSINHGDEWIADRMTPLHGDSEPDTPRLCVCPSIAGCMTAALFSRGHPVHVYLTEPRRAIKPGRQGWDSAITGEVWIVPPVRLVRVGEISAQTTTAIQRPARKHIEIHEASSVGAKIETLELAIEHLRTIKIDGARSFTTSDRRVVAIWKHRESAKGAA